jgi:hypothetical protein
MQRTLKTSASRLIGAVVALAAGWIAGSPAISVAMASDAMPVAQQNALVQKYCAVCHSDAHLNGGLSLEHFDAARPDPGVAAMIVSKLKAKALGASGQPLPDKATQDALLHALSAESAGANAWTVNQTQDPAAKAPLLSAGIVREAPSAANDGEPDLYRLTLTCRADTHEGEMQLTWSPGVPPQGRAMSVAVDEKAPFAYRVEGSEKMGNGAEGTSGPGAAILYATNSGAPKLVTPLPEHTLTISNLFAEETVVFPFGNLSPSVRQALSPCFTGSGTSY